MIKAVRLPSQEYLRERFWYDPENGQLHWNCWPIFGSEWQLRYAGYYAGCRKRNGHFVRINGVTYKTARIIWKWMTGVDPAGEIDHRDVDRYNNKWSNLRDSTRQQNGRNRLPYAKSGLPKGVSFNCTRTRYHAKIVVNYTNIYLGAFDTIDEAAAAYNAAAIEHYGEFARLNP